MTTQPMSQTKASSIGTAQSGERDLSMNERRRRPSDLDAEENERWTQQCAELDRALGQGDEARALHALAMLDRLRYGCH